MYYFQEIIALSFPSVIELQERNEISDQRKLLSIIGLLKDDLSEAFLVGKGRRQVILHHYQGFKRKQSIVNGDNIIVR